MPGFKQINKRQQKYLKIIYRLEENEVDQSRKEEGYNSLSETYQIESADNPYHIPANAQLWGALPMKQLAGYSLQNEFYLDEQRASALKQDITHYAWERLLKYLSFRERSITECRKYLQNLPLKGEISNELIKRATEKKFLDETRFAELLTESYISRHKSRTELKTALIEKRISPEIVEQVLQEHYKDENQREILQYHIEKGIRKYPAQNSAKDHQKCIAYLLRKGFHYSDFRDELKSYYRNSDDYSEN